MATQGLQYTGSERKMKKHSLIEDLSYPEIGLYESLHRLLDSFYVIGDWSFICAIPSDTPSELSKSIMAAIKAHSLGLKSVDYTLKKYGEDWEVGADNLSDGDKVFDNILKHVRNEVARIVDWVTSFDNKPDRVGLVAAGCALRRLETSFRAAGILIRLGYIFEASAICRLILEQLAWAYSVHQIENEDVLRILPTRAVSEIKHLLPDAGRVYGFLSKFTHIAPELTHLYIAFDDKDVSVYLNFTDERLEWIWALLYLADYYSVVTEYIYRDVIPNLTVIEQDQAGNYRVKQDRPLQKLIKLYRDKLIESS